MILPHHGTIKIGRATISNKSKVFIIAEAGVNHNGNPKLAERLVTEVAKAGADCVKFQTFKAERIATAEAPKARYQLKTTNPKESQLQMLRKLELKADAYRRLIKSCDRKGLIFLSTPYSPEDVDFLDRLGVKAFKLASIHIAEPSFLEYVARKQKPVILSTGMSTMTEIKTAIRSIYKTGNRQLVLLHCTTNYPTAAQDVNLRAMQTIHDHFQTLVGYSDHTADNLACIGAVTLGARVIEKHFTLDRSLPGPDQSSSADPAQLRDLVKAVRQAEEMLGSAIKKPCAVERSNAEQMRRSIVSKREIRKGEMISSQDLVFKRPATGIKPVLLSKVIGCIAKQNIKEDEILTWKMISRKKHGH